jgi:hypothetical protein
MVNLVSTAQILNNDYTALGNWIGVSTGVPAPGALNEATGGSPAYARQSTTWTPGTNGSAAGSPVTLNLVPGTYPYMIMCSGSSGNNMVDWCILPTPIVVTGTQAAIVITPASSTS